LGADLGALAPKGAAATLLVIVRGPGVVTQFRNRVSSAGKVWGERVTEKLVWHVVKQFAAKIGVKQARAPRSPSKLRPPVPRRWW